MLQGSKDNTKIRENIYNKELISFIVFKMLESFGIVVTIRSILISIFEDKMLSSHTWIEIIILSILFGIIYIFLDLHGPVLGYNTALKKIKIYKQIENYDKAIEISSKILDRKKLSCEQEAEIRYELAFMYLEKNKLILSENQVHEILKLSLDKKPKTNMLLKIGTYIYGAIDSEKSIEYIDEALKNGYSILKDTDFFKEDSKEINAILLIDKYLDAGYVERAKEIFKKLVENKCCKNYKSVRGMLR